MRTQGKRTEEASARAFQKKSTRTRDGCARSRWKGRSETRAQETVCYILPPLEFGSHRWAEVEMRKSDGRATEERWKCDGRATEGRWKSRGSSEKVFLEEREMFGEGLPGRATGVRECSGRARAELAPSSRRVRRGGPQPGAALTISSTSAVARQGEVLPVRHLYSAESPFLLRISIPARLRLHDLLSSTKWGSPSALSFQSVRHCTDRRSGTGEVAPGGC